MWRRCIHAKGDARLANFSEIERRKRHARKLARPAYSFLRPRKPLRWARRLPHAVAGSACCCPALGARLRCNIVPINSRGVIYSPPCRSAVPPPTAQDADRFTPPPRTDLVQRPRCTSSRIGVFLYQDVPRQSQPAPRKPGSWNNGITLAETRGIAGLCNCQHYLVSGDMRKCPYCLTEH